MESNKLTIKDSSLSFLIGFLLCQIGVVAVTCTTMMVYTLCGFDMNFFSSFLNKASGYMITALGMYLSMLGVFFYFNRKKENEIFSSTKLKKIMLYILVAIASFLTLYPIINCIDSLLVKCGAKINTLPYTLTTKNYLISLISLVVAPAVCEELLFRGVIFKGLKKYGKTFSILISSLMFSIYHMAISQTVYPILMGILLAVIMFYENNIYYCITVHLTNNFLSLTLSYFKINLIFNHWTYILLAIALLVAFLTITLSLTIKQNNFFEKIKIEKSDKLIFFACLGIMIFIWILVNLF